MTLAERARSLERPRLSFEAKVFGLFAVTAISALVVAFSAFQWLNWQADRVELVREQTTLGQMIAPETARAIQRGDAGLLAAAGALARGNPLTTNVAWFPASGGHIQLMTSRKGAGTLRPSGASQPTSQFDAKGLVVHIPHFADGRKVGELVIRAHEEEIKNNLVRNSLAALVLTVGATLISTLFAKLLLHQSLRPLRALDRGIETVRNSRNFNHLVEVTSNDEFGRLTESFNGLLADLQIYETRQQLSVRELAAARDEAQTSNRSKSVFLANMSHEIRTPLNGVLGVAEALSRTQLSPSQRELVDIIDTSGRALEALVSNLLDFARIESGKLELRPEPFDLVNMVEACSSLFAPNAKEKHLDFRVDIAPQVEGAYLGDAPRIRQILLNLLSNAVKFTAEGSILLSVGGDASKDGASLTFTVSDTGIGFDEETGKRLFERFEQADSSITRKYGGTGLGLAISRSLALAMGGALEATAMPGLGATFTLTVYCLRAEAVAAPPELCVVDAPAEATSAGSQEGTSTPPRAAASDAGAMRVLVVDDHPTNRKVAEVMLSTFGVNITVAQDGAEAVEAWRLSPFDLILMDMQMPVMDGLSAIRKIREIETHEGRAHTPIWTLTGNALPEHALASYAAGADGHETKPVTLEKLRAVLKAVSGGVSEEIQPAMFAAVDIANALRRAKYVPAGIKTVQSGTTHRLHRLG